MRFETLTPVWGDRYVDRVLGYVVPSWLAPGNLPAISRIAPLRITFLTSRADAARMTRHYLINRLREWGEVAFTEIDDLLGQGSYSVPLTLSFHRGLAGAYRPGQSTQCLLLNADFVVADGALETAARALRNGARIVQAPSLRVTEDRIGSRLARRIDEKGALAIAPRDMVAEAFEALHPTVLASRPDQSAFVFPRAHQFHWRADEHTLIARPFLMFALALTVDRPPAPARSYADYGMPFAVAGADAPIHALTDSDEFLSLELAPKEQEAALIRAGPWSREAVAAAISSWSTPYNRAQARNVVYFRSGPPATGVVDACERAEEFVSALIANLSPPLPTQDHPNWVAEVVAWRKAQAQLGRDARPPELALDGLIGAEASHAPKAGEEVSQNPLRRWARALLVGLPGETPRFWQPYHRLHALLHAEIAGREVQAIGSFGLFDPALERFRRAGVVAPLRIAGIDPSDGQQMERTLTGLREMSAANQDFALVLMRRDGGEISGAHVLHVWSGLETWATLQRLAPTDLRVDLQVAHTYGALADHGDLRSASAATLRLACEAAIGLARMTLSNVAQTIGAKASVATGWVISARTRDANKHDGETKRFDENAEMEIPHQ